MDLPEAIRSSIISYDDEFFSKLDNAPTAHLTPVDTPSFFASILRYIVKPVFAHHPPGHNALPECYHERSAYLARFMFTNAHESGSKPDMKITVTNSFEVMPDPPWYNTRVPGQFYEYEDADETNTWYPLEGEKYHEILKHNGHWCDDGEVFDASDSNYGREDEVNVKVTEIDLSSWVNPDDTVGHWKYVPTFGAGTGGGTERFTPTSTGTVGDDQDAYVTLLFHYPGENLYH